VILGCINVNVTECAASICYSKPQYTARPFSRPAQLAAGFGRVESSKFLYLCRTVTTIKAAMLKNCKRCWCQIQTMQCKWWQGAWKCKMVLSISLHYSTYLVNFVKHKKEETFTCLPGLQTVCIQAWISWIFTSIKDRARIVRKQRLQVQYQITSDASWYVLRHSLILATKLQHKQKGTQYIYQNVVPQNPEWIHISQRWEANHWIPYM
jgi:hypothetical protein